MTKLNDLHVISIITVIILWRLKLGLLAPTPHGQTDRRTETGRLQRGAEGHKSRIVPFSETVRSLRF